MEEAEYRSGKRKLSLSLKNQFKKTSKEELREMTLPQLVLTNHSACIKHQRVIYALSAM